MGNRQIASENREKQIIEDILIKKKELIDYMVNNKTLVTPEEYELNRVRLWSELSQLEDLLFENS